VISQPVTSNSAIPKTSSQFISIFFYYFCAKLYPVPEKL
jgi:hypothetical protein